MAKKKPTTKKLRNESSAEGRHIWKAVELAASRAPEWIKERAESASSSNERRESAMKVLDIDVDWMEGWDNNPKLKVLVDRIPKMEEMTFKRSGNCWLAIKDGYARFFYGDPNKVDTGYGGAHFHLNTEDGEVVLKGPWSSNSEAINGAFPDEPNVMEVTVTDDPEVWERGYTFFAGAAVVGVIASALEEHMPEVKLSRCRLEFIHPVWKDGRCVKCHGSGQRVRLYGDGTRECGHCGGSGREPEVVPVKRKKYGGEGMMSGEQTEVVEA